MAYIQQGDTLEMTTENTGTQGVLYIEDTGSYVHLGIRCKDPNYTKTKLSFTWKAPGSSGTIKSWTLPAGGGLIPVRSFAVGVSGDITFTLNNVGDIQNNMINFIENHDEQRVASDYFLTLILF